MSDPDAPRQTVRITIFNQTYSISTSADPRETQRLAEEIDDLMASIAKKAGNLDSTRTAVLACLHLADKLRQTQQQYDTFRASVAGKTRAFVLQLDRAFESESDRF